MEDSKYYELREQLIERLHSFMKECEELDMDAETEVDDLLEDAKDSF